MDLSEARFGDLRPFDGYGPGFFRIGGELFEGPVVTSPAATTPWDGYGDAETLLKLAGEVDVIFVGTGAEIAHVPGDLRIAVEEAGMGLEVMASPAACRTYNVLVGEGRRVAAAVLPV
ncbi:hypothetical protein JSE7799_01313 [Jannaschia seosinensis]|uniref:Mth938-like domain-containing protein n=1 Tax=Jannaschia seosinensis TaxID=313367 RepID=A0A0M7B745_9RHOB|nr:Mth938-like domain-containing protein [Jannaschia seosinensis]CUH37631.1 hypothetical protein JSE7799_01313 [Jannaschia seosinensis]